MSYNEPNGSVSDARDAPRPAQPDRSLIRASEVDSNVVHEPEADVLVAEQIATRPLAPALPRGHHATRRPRARAGDDETTVRGPVATNDVSASAGDVPRPARVHNRAITYNPIGVRIAKLLVACWLGRVAVPVLDVVAAFLVVYSAYIAFMHLDARNQTLISIAEILSYASFELERMAEEGLV